MKRVTLIQCTDSKRKQPCRAYHMYDKSRYYRKMRSWAKAKGRPWYILSAKYELLNPNREIEPYDERGLSKQQAENIAAELDEMGVETVDVTAGRDYTNHLVPALERRGIDVINHFAGCKIGTREKKLKHATERLRSKTL